MKIAKKKHIILLLALAALVALIIVAAGCNKASQAPGSSGSTVASSKGIVGLGISDATVARRPKEMGLIKDGLTKLGYTVLGPMNANGDSNTQEQQMKDMLTAGAKILCFFAVDSKSSAQIVSDAHAAGAKVVGYVIPVGGDLDYYVSEDNDKCGTMMGDYVVQHLQKGNIAFLNGDKMDSNAAKYHDGAMKELQPKINSGDYKVVFDQYCQGWSADAALSNAQNCLTQNHNNIQAFICGNDQIAGAAIEALKAQGLAGKVIVTGGDCELAAVQRIMEGTQSMTVLKNAYTISGAAVTMIDQIMQGQTPTTNSVWSNGDKNNIPTMFVPMTTITKDNVQQELVDTNYYTKDQIGAQYFQ